MPLKTDLLTPWHGFQEHVTEDTITVYLGDKIVSVEHYCMLSWDSTVRVGRIEAHFHAKKKYATTLVLVKPTHDATPAAYCKTCNTLYVGRLQ